MIVILQEKVKAEGTQREVAIIRDVMGAITKKQIEEMGINYDEFLDIYSKFDAYVGPRKAKDIPA